MPSDAPEPGVLTPPSGIQQLAPADEERSPLLPIVGIGASAGGLKAICGLLADLPGDTGMAFVVIQHLDPDHESLLPLLLSRSSHLPVAAAEDGVKVQANRVYVITPNTNVRVEGGFLRTSPRAAEPRPNLSIDAFFKSLAADQPGNAIGVVLSGTGTDGTVGLAAIKASGGITFAQDLTAEHSGMPLSAIAGGHVDFVLRPAEIAVEIGKVARFGFPTLPPSPVKDDPETAAPDGQALIAADPAQYALIMDRLRTATGVDFTDYRKTTIMRRTMRRMALGTKATLAEYVRHLDEQPQEIAALARDILIHVTSFYRDQAAFDAMKSLVFPALMHEREATAPIRLWVVGCSTGQEAYSLAMELTEYLQGFPIRPQVQIFATDISDWALCKARIGWYPDSISDVIPADRLVRYFTREGPGYRITKAIRKLCIFAKHDITAHIPFSKIDLITCRNVLIYLGPTLQRQVLPIFHFALKPGGFLILGASETVGRSSRLYETIDEKNRIYRSVVAHGRHKHPRYFPFQNTGQTMASPSQPSRPPFTDAQHAADQIVLNRFAPAGVLVTEAMDVLQFRGQTSPFLEFPHGEPSLNLLTMVPFGVAAALREVLSAVKRTNLPVRREAIVHRRGQSFREITIECVPVKLPTATAPCYLVLFEEHNPPQSASPAAAPSTAAAGNPIPAGKEQRELSLLRSELGAAVDCNHALVEENHALKEQLSASQEETQSSTEEFRSTNEELQTAKEEVESTNEELVTINDELRASNEELAKASAALRASAELTAAILETMRYPLLMLDPELRVESVNQAFLDAFHVSRQESIGRLVYELGDGQWNIPALRRLLVDILPHNSAFDDFEVTHDFRHIGTRTMLLNARRLKGDNEQVRLIVLVIADVTEQARYTASLKEVSGELRRSNADLDEFAAVASHDLQEPLRMITSYLSLLQHQYGALFDERARKHMGVVTESAQRMAEMIKGILSYSQLGHEAAVAVSTDSSAVLKGALANLKVRIEDAHATIVAGPLPRVQANPEQLMRLFQNLLSNALKFRSEDRASEIRVTAAESEVEWTFAVTDNGIGMEKADHQKLFQLFQRLNGRSVPGTGIGLAACRKILEHHGGRIWVESEPDVGSTFFFTLPKR